MSNDNVYKQFFGDEYKQPEAQSVAQPTALDLACRIDDAVEQIRRMWSRQVSMDIESGPNFEPPTQRAGELLEHIEKAVAGIKRELGK